MGKSQSILEKNGYVIEQQHPTIIASKGDDKFLIKIINLEEIPGIAVPALISEIETLQKISHPHIVSSKNSFEFENTYYVVMDYCQESLATKIKEMNRPPQESEVLSYIVEICMALKTIHEKNLLHKDLTTEHVFLTDFGVVCLGGFGKIHENSNKSPSATNSNVLERIHHLAPEVFTEGTYDAKSDIWSVGCLLYELCTQKPVFSAETTTIQLMPKIISGPYPKLPAGFSAELCELLHDIFTKDPTARPTASEILERPFVIKYLSKKAETTVEELQTKVNELRALANGLERVHQGTTIGSLAGGVIGAVGGITSIVGLILAPFTLGASLIVTGVGIGVGALGGTAAGVSNITNMVNQSSDRRAVRRIIKEIEHKINAVVTWLQEIKNSLETIRNQYGDLVTSTTEDNGLNGNLTRIGARAGRGLGGVAELIRLVQVMNVGRIAAQASRIVRVAEVATGVLSGLFIAVDIFFIAMDAKEIHHIRQAKAVEEENTRQPVSRAESIDSVPTFDKAQLLMQDFEPEISESEAQSPSDTTPIRSEIMKFVRAIRQAADNLQKIVNELRSICSTLPSDNGELEWQDMVFR